MDTVFFVLFILCSSVLGAIYEKFDDLPTSNFDFIIVGGGTAGNVLANRLTENANISVLILEAGGSTADVLLSEVPFFCVNATPGTPWDWNFTTTEQPGLNGRSVSFPRGFGLGGSSAVNYMFYTRGSFQDYDRYAQISGDPGWGWEALQPYIRKNEHFVPPSDHHNTTGQFDPAVHSFNGINSVSLPGYPRATDGRVIQTTSELSDDFPFNLDYNSGFHLGVGWAPYTIGNGTRSSSQTSYLGTKFIGRPNLHVLTSVHVTRILQSNITSDSGPTFDAVEFTQDAGGDKIFELKEVILSAGSVGTPHILLHSGVGDATELTALGITPTLHLPDVGKNLTDHTLTSVNFFVNDTDTIENIYLRNSTFQAEALAEWQTNRTGFLSTGISSQVGFLRVPEDANILDGDPCAGNETGHYELIFTNGIPFAPVPAGNFFSIGIVGICPLSRGNITINSTNPLDPPLINPNYLSNPQDIAIMQYAADSAKKFVTAAVWDGYILGLVANTTENDIRNGVGSIFHPVGTTAMSPADADWGVVNPDLKLKGAKGVRIVDASILPLVPAGHTQVPVYIFAERAADLIKADI
ncbi:aryl-alcohol oxidase-like protein [Guyanagaster necrorhizus]|uniref:Aryl-alcohol oxidase-like protein n=1 Tax=Guyanagaster necrorhizus TaxID=856835 RepID=A0A9P7VR58_9AGAR|nr:aryl-alcohol oxidase-like protein [Guyanagaster necrorhizus MCA 3950]KAG7445389.1 aryl-alcohol oxidase-like protein [Guyanagaster necrorhizus MCA 3950]